MPKGRKVGTVKFARPFKVRFQFGYMEELEELLDRASNENIDHQYLRSKQHLLREVLRRGLDSIKSQIEEEQGPQQLLLLDDSTG